MVQELTFVPSTVVLGINKALNEVFGLSVDNEWRWRWLIAIGEGVGVLRFELQHMKYQMNANSTGEAQCEGHGRQLGYNREGANLAFS